MSKCDSCTHPEVCKYKEDFQAFEKSQIPLDKPYCLEASCRYFCRKPLTAQEQLQQLYCNQQTGPYYK